MSNEAGEKDSKQSEWTPEKMETMNATARRIAHYIRNPLHSISFAVGLLRNAKKKRIQNILYIIVTIVNSADIIVKNLMHFSANSSQRLSLTDVNLLLKERLSKIMLPQNVKLTSHYNDVPQLKIDAEQIDRSFFYLIYADRH